MSLIQDALKRQQEESEISRIPLKTAPVPSVPDTMPVPSSPEPVNRPLPVDRPLPAVSPAMDGTPVDPEKPVQPGKSWKLIVGIIILCVLIAWSGGLMAVLILKQSAVRTLLGPLMPERTKVQAPPPSMAMAQPVVTPLPALASASSPLLSPAAAAAPAFADEGEDAEENVALQGVKEQVAPGVVPGPATWPQRKISAIFSSGGADQKDARLKPVVWPRLKLSAVFSNVGSGQSGARLNNRLILLGDQIDGVTLVEIRRDSVVLKCGQETRSLKMGVTLN